VFYGGFVWACRLLNGTKRWFSARAVRGLREECQTIAAALRTAAKISPRHLELQAAEHAAAVAALMQEHAAKHSELASGHAAATAELGAHKKAHASALHALVAEWEGKLSLGRHCQSTLSLAAIDCHCLHV
jgi:hypothetical protein